MLRGVRPSQHHLLRGRAFPARRVLFNQDMRINSDFRICSLQENSQDDPMVKGWVLSPALLACLIISLQSISAERKLLQMFPGGREIPLTPLCVLSEAWMHTVCPFLVCRQSGTQECQQLLITICNATKKPVSQRAHFKQSFLVVLAVAFFPPPQSPFKVEFSLPQAYKTLHILAFPHNPKT